MTGAAPELDAQEASSGLVSEVRGTRAGLLVLLGIGGLNLGNAAFHLVTARLLGPAQYGEVVSLVTVQGLIALPFGGVQYAVARFVADDAVRGDAEAVAFFIRRALASTLVVASVLTITVTAVSPLVRHSLDVQKLTPVVLTALYLLPAMLAPVLWGVAQGLQRFGLISFSLVVGVGCRLGLVLLLIPFGLGVGGVMGATLVAAFATLVIPFPLVWSWVRRAEKGLSGPTRAIVLRYLAPVMAGTLAVTSLTTVDLIAAKLSLSSADAGIYGSASFIGRLLLYLPMTIATVLLPKVTSRAAVDRDTKEILHASLAVTALFSLTGTGLLVLVPHLVVNLTFGSTYGGAVPLIGIFGLAMTAYALLNVQLVYHLGHGRAGMAWFLLAGALCQIAIYTFVHGSTYQLAFANLGTAVALLLVHEIFFERTLLSAIAWFLARLRHRIA